MMSARELGKTLMDEIDEVGLGELLREVFASQNDASWFGWSALDNVVRLAMDCRRPASSNPRSSTSFILELMSLAPGSGKTHMLYHLTAIAVLSRAFGGTQACVLIVDTDERFSVPRLATQIRTMVAGSRSSNTVSDIDKEILTALEHVHILHPQTLASTTATIRSIPEYLFNAQEHRSFERTVAFVALDSLSSFYWQNKAENEHADLLSSTTAGMQAVQHPASYAQLAGATQYMAKQLQCPVIITTQYQGLPKRAGPNTDDSFNAYSFRSPLPPPWGALPVLRLVTHRAAVRKIPASTSLAEARREASNRQAVLDQGRFECFVNEYGLDESTASKLRALNASLGFFVREGGLAFDPR